MLRRVSRVTNLSKDPNFVMKTFPLRCAFIVLVATTISAPATTYFVDLNSLNPAPPYADWNTAATNIQDAVDVAAPGDLVLVTNGVYRVGERADGDGQVNRVAVTKALTLQSVNGPAETHIVGFRPIAPPFNRVRCVYLAAGATLSGFTLTNGAASNGGGGVLCESVTAVVSNCVMNGNSATFGGGAYGGTVIASGFINNNASNGGGGAASNLVLQSTFLENRAMQGGAVYGSQVQHSLLLTNSALWSTGGTPKEAGGAYQSQLNNCLLVGNRADYAGGASQSALVNCTIVANAASQVSGVNGCRLTNSIVYYNSNLSPASSAQHFGSTFWHCNVTNPVVAGGNNFSVAPGFVNPAANDFRLQPDSPNINSGYNPVAAPTDLDGHPRVMGGSVDLGAYEYQTPTSNLSYYWAGLLGLPLDGSADELDPDGDGLNNVAEWRAGTSPTNALSTLRMENVTKLTDRVIVRWQSVATRFYWLERTTNPGTAAFETIATQIPGSGGTQMYHDLTAANGESYFYRVGVH